MAEKQLKGIKIIRSGNLPVEIFNEKTKEIEVFHMLQSWNTLYVSDELYQALIRNKGECECLTKK